MKIKSDSRPLYQRVEEALFGLLATASPGDRLPPEPELARSLGISRATLREALRHLEQQAIITRRQGVGTFYNGPRLLIDSGLEVLASIDTMAANQGLSCSTADLRIAHEPAEPDSAAALGLAEGQRVTAVRRTKVSEGSPIAYMVDVLPERVATLEEVREGFQGSVLDFLLARPGLSVSHAVANIVPLKAGRELSRHLNVSGSTVLLLLKETVYTQEGAAIDYSRNYFVPQYFQFHLVRRVSL